MKRLAFVFSAVCFCFALGGCNRGSQETTGSGSEQGPITLTIEEMFTAEEALTSDETRINRAAVSKFAEDHADELNLIITETPQDDYAVKAQAFAAADDLPDIFALKGSWAYPFYSSGLLGDITEAVNNCEWKDRYQDEVFVPVTMEGGTIVGVPTQWTTTSIVYYNKELWASIGYDEFPSTWEEVFAAVPKFQEMGIDTIEFGNDSKWQYNSSWVSSLAPRVTGEQWVNDIIAGNGNANFTDPDFIKFLELTIQIGASGALNADYPVIGHQRASSLFLQGRAATTIDGFWNVSYINTHATPEMIDKIGYAYMPTVEGGKGNPKSISAGGGWYLAISSRLTGKAKELAEELLLYVSGPATAQPLTDVGQIGTCRCDPSADAEISPFNRDYLSFVNNAAGSVPVWDAHMQASLIENMNDQFVELLAGRTTAEAAAAVIQAEYERIRQ